MFSSMPEYVQAVSKERERQTQLAFMAHAAEQLTADERPRRPARMWAHFIAVRMPRSVRFLSAGRA